jgi:hypothetical protein
MQSKQSSIYQRGEDSLGDTKNLSIKDYLNLQLGQGAILTVQTPGGTKTTIVPVSSDQGRGKRKEGQVFRFGE